MGRLILAIDEKVLLNFFTVPLIFFLISSTRAPKNKSKHRALFSECGGAYERLLWYRKKITVYSLQKSRLHHWPIGFSLSLCLAGYAVVYVHYVIICLIALASHTMEVVFPKAVLFRDSDLSS